MQKPVRAGLSRSVNLSVVERYLTAEDVRGAARRPPGSAATLADDFSQALRAGDVGPARGLILGALAQGVAPGRLYVDVVRPGLQQLDLDGPAAESGRETAELGQALIADLAGALPLTLGGGAGRAALLSCGELTIERLDGDVVAAFLEADGWAVQRHRGPEAALSLGPASRAGGVELAVAVVAGPDAALRLAAACTDMNRLPDPPVCLLCDFTGRSDWPAASIALGADALISDPQELLEQAARRLPAGETRRWGVSIATRDDALWLVPTGRLDGTSAERLAEVVESRIGRFSKLVVDLRDLAEISPAGVKGILEWSRNGPLKDVPVQLVGDADVRTRISALGPAAAVLPLADAAAV